MKQTVINKTVIVSMLLAGLGWGAWAYIVNIQSQNVIPTTVLQIVYSVVMTIYMSFSIHFVSKKVNGKWQKLLLPTIVTIGHTGVILVLAHYLNGTQNLFLTIIFPIIVGTVYSLFLSCKYYTG